MQPQMSGASAPTPAPPPARVTPGPAVVRSAPKRPPRTGVWFLVGAVLLAAAGTYLYQSRNAAREQAKKQVAVVRTGRATFGDVHRTIRITGVVAALNSAAILVPQMRGSRGDRGRQASNASIAVSIPSTPDTLMGAAASTTGGDSSGSSAALASTGSGSTNANPGASNTSSLGAKRGTTNRFSSSSSSSSSSKSSGSGGGDATVTADLGSTAGQGGTGGGGGGFGGGGHGGDFDMVLLDVAPAGSHVQKGDPVAEFDRQFQLLRLDDYRASVVQLDANIKKLKANLAMARDAYKQLLKVAKADVDKAELDLKTISVRSAIESEEFKLAADEARARYKQLVAEQKLAETSYTAQLRAAEIDRDQSKIELQRAENNVNRMIMKTPIDGIIVMQSIFRGGDMGQIQKGDQLHSGMMFMSIVDPSSMVVNATINQVDSEVMRLGMKATARFDAYPDLELPATVIGIGAMTKPGGWRASYLREIPIRLKIDRMDPRVIPDLSASAEVILESQKDTTVVPREAVFRDSPDAPAYVFLSGPAGFIRKEIEAGLASNIAIAVRSGLRKDDVIALQRP